MGSAISDAEVGMLISETVSNTGLEALIVQGGSIGAILIAFMFMLKFLTTQLTKNLRNLENAQLITTSALLSLSIQIMHHDMKLSGLTIECFQDKDEFKIADSKAIEHLNELKREIEKAIQMIERHISTTTKE